MKTFTVPLHEKCLVLRNSKYEVETLYGRLNGSTYECDAYLDALIRGMGAQYRSDSNRQLKVRFTRVEFIHRVSLIAGVDLDGAILFDQQDRPLLHLPNAQLGYHGSGPGHSKEVLKLIGVPSSIFDQVNSDVEDDRKRGKSYAIAVYLDRNGQWYWERLR